MNSKILKAVKNGNKATMEELFGLVNVAEITKLMIRKPEENTLMAMQINKYEEMSENYIFSQSCVGYDDCFYTLKKDDIVSVATQYYEDIDTFYITSKLKTGMEMLLLFVNAAKVEKQLSDFREIDLYELKEFLEETVCRKNEYYCISARITDIFGFDVKMYPRSVYINNLEEEWKLHISSDSDSVDIPVVDDSVNEFYIKEMNGSRKIIVKPFNQPFMEISMLFFRKHD